MTSLAQILGLGPTIVCQKISELQCFQRLFLQSGVPNGSYSEPANICFSTFTSFLSAIHTVHHSCFLLLSFYRIFSQFYFYKYYPNWDCKWTHAIGNVAKLQCFIQFTKVNTQGLMQQSHDFCSFKKAVHANLSFPFQHDF